MTQPHYIDRGLLPCPNPWCDSGVQPMSFAMRGGFHQVICGCDFKGPRKATKEEAEDAWNRRPPVNIALPKPALAQTDGYKTADPTLLAVIRQWLDADDPTVWGPFERALDGLISGEPTKCAVCGCLSLDGKAYFPARKGPKP